MNQIERLEKLRGLAKTPENHRQIDDDIRRAKIGMAIEQFATENNILVVDAYNCFGEFFKRSEDEISRLKLSPDFDGMNDLEKIKFLRKKACEIFTRIPDLRYRVLQKPAWFIGKSIYPNENDLLKDESLDRVKKIVYEVMRLMWDEEL